MMNLCWQQSWLRILVVVSSHVPILWKSQSGNWARALGNGGVRLPEVIAEVAFGAGPRLQVGDHETPIRMLFCGLRVRRRFSPFGSMNECRRHLVDAVVLIHRLSSLHHFLFADALVDLMELRLNTRQLVLDLQQLGLVVVALVEELGLAGRRIDDDLIVIDHLFYFVSPRFPT